MAYTVLDDSKASHFIGLELSCAHEFDIRCEICKLRTLCLPAALSADELTALENIIEERYLVKANDHVYRVDSKFTAIYAIISGAVKTYRTDSEGRVCVTGFHLPGELFGFSGINQGHYSISARALDDTWVCELPFDDLEKSCRAIPGLQSRLVHLMSDRIVGYQEHLAQLKSSKTAQNRLALFLLSLSSRAARRGESGTHLQLPMTGQDIGNYLGISAEAVSRGFTRLTRCNAISKNKRDITILDLRQLRGSVCQLATPG